MVFLAEVELTQIALAQFKIHNQVKYLYLTEDACVFLSAQEAQDWANKIERQTRKCSRVMTYSREMTLQLLLENEATQAPETVLPKSQKKTVKNRK